MPIYEYRCDDCEHQFDALQKMSESPLTDCPECGIASLRKMVSAPNFRLKGGGWYETDFKSDKDKKRNLADDGKPAGDAKGGGEKKDAKADKSAARSDKASNKSKSSSGDSGKAT
ncbi:MAG: zinc ribbon domain-containing protein [Pseudomonadota bacterium]